MLHGGSQLSWGGLGSRAGAVIPARLVRGARQVFVIRPERNHLAPLGWQGRVFVRRSFVDNFTVWLLAQSFFEETWVHRGSLIFDPI